MGIISRFFLLIYVLVVGVSLIVAAGVCLHLIPPFIWQEKLKYIIAQQETLIVLAVMFFFSLYFLGMAFSSNKSTRITEEITLNQGEPGQVTVAIAAIKRLAERAALSVNGVREASIVVNNQNGDVPIAIKLTMVLGQGYAAPIVSEAVIKAIDKAIITALQMPNVPVDVSVKEITNAIVERKQRVM